MACLKLVWVGVTALAVHLHWPDVCLEAATCALKG